jgi:hypothetical protein
LNAETLLAGFGETDITPRKPVSLKGYYYERLSTGVHDPLAARAMAVSDGRNRAVLCVLDLVYIHDAIVHEARRAVEERCGLPGDQLLLSCVHTHTGPDCQQEEAYAATLPLKIAEAVEQSLTELKPVTFRIALGEERTVAFVRRYRMKDGSVRTNPGILNPEVEAPLGTPDYALTALATYENGAPTGGVVHYGLHCDTVGGTEISADWTHYVRECLREKFGPDTALLTPIGTAGDINHWNVFEAVNERGFAETERIGCAIGAAAAQALEHAEPVKFGPVRAGRKALEAALRSPSEEELAEAHRIMDEAPPEGVDFTMDRVEALRRIRVAERGPTASLDITALTFGKVAFVGLPCELFTELGRDIKARSPFPYTVVVTLSDASIGYVGPREAFETGAYEMTSTLLQPGMGERLADTAVRLLGELYS